MSLRVVKNTLSGLVIDDGAPGDRDLHWIAHNSNRIRSRQLPSGAWGRRWSKLRCRARSSPSTCRAGDSVVAGQQLMLIESMKMHHAIESPCDGTVVGLLVEAGATVMAGAAVASVEPGVVRQRAAVDVAAADLDRVRPDLAEVQARHAVGLDAARPDAVAQRRAVGRRTARENVADLVDEGSFVEYGPVVIAAQRRRRPRRRADRTHARPTA